MPSSYNPSTGVPPITNYNEVDAGKYFKLVITFISYIFQYEYFWIDEVKNLRKEKSRLLTELQQQQKREVELKRKIGELEDYLYSVEEENTLL